MGEAWRAVAFGDLRFSLSLTAVIRTGDEVKGFKGFKPGAL